MSFKETIPQVSPEKDVSSGKDVLAESKKGFRLSEKNREEIDKEKQGEDKIEKNFLELLNNNFSKKDVAEINKALVLAKEIHEDQLQPDGKAYIEHPMEVASIVIEKFKLNKADLVITALLHDAIEDQSERLFLSYLEKNNFLLSSTLNVLNFKSFIDKFSDEIREVAYLEIRSNFDHSIAERVRRLSKPDFDNLIDTLNFNVQPERKQKIKNKMYGEYFSALLDHNDQGLSVVKCADLLNNVSKNHLLDEGPKKRKLIDKYAPVISNIVIPFLKKIEPQHCLYENSQLILKDFSEIYKRDFIPNYSK